ncbi:MAG: hypothetical protein MI922_22110, partial [Bacteroidales bacterium]|nr:hypothetical protein [Bacteroidales bacterium]
MIGLVIAVICAILCAVVASNKGRSAVGWFFLGFFFGIFGLIASLIASDIGAREEKEKALEGEQRRLREQLHQERIKNEQLRLHTQHRLDRHDDLLQVDTRNVLDTTGTTGTEILNAGPQPPEIEA